MKKYLFIITLASSLILTGCSKSTIEAPVIEETTGATINSGITATNIPTCTPEKLNNAVIVNIDNLVKNCTEKEKEGRFLDGLGGYTPIYKIYNNQILIEQGNDPAMTEGVICRTANKDGSYEYITNYGVAEAASIEGYEITKRMIGKGLLDAIDGLNYEDKIYCNAEDVDCSKMKESGGWTDGQNYFIAGYRNDLMTNEDWHKLYVINDKIYYPGKSINANGVMVESKWNFIGIKDKKAIMTKMTKGILVGDPEKDIEHAKSKYTLKTCEMDLQ